MTQATQLNPTEQDALVKQIGLALLRAAPEDWEQVLVDYRAVGRHSEAVGEVLFADGASEPWPVSPDIAALFARLRAGMYRSGRGTWFNAHYRLDRPSSYNLDYDRDEPAWDVPPPPQAYADDLRTFPRDEENVPEWLRRRLAPAPAAKPAASPRFRVARIFDGTGNAGRPLINRPPLDDADRADLLDYLDAAPLVVPARGHDIDLLDADSRPQVPVAFHSDGTWIWPAAVNYYLRSYGVPPEPDLVEHVFRRNFELPDVDEETVAAAAAFLSRGGPPKPGGPPPPGRPPARPPAPRADQSPGGPGRPGGPPPRPVPPPRPPAPPPPALPDPPASRPPGPPASALPSQEPPEVTIDHVRSRLAELGVPESSYRIGAPGERGWTMDRTPDGWRVGWYEREFVAPALFEDVADASAFLVGKVLLDNGRPDTRTVEAPAPPLAERPMGAPMETQLVAPPAVPPGPPAPPVPSAEPPMSPPPPVRAEPEPVKPEPSIPEPEAGAQPPREITIGAAETAALLAGLDPSSSETVEVPEDRIAPPPPVGPPAPPLPPPSPPPPAAAPASPPAAAPSAAKQNQVWPINPLPGEPPLTLFRGKRLVELPPGTELDRFGDPDGNLTYTRGTPFEERSLVPEWIHRSYHVYRLTQPVEALSGEAIPWFDQPGGGIAYLLPDSIAEMLADGRLVEAPDREPPPR